MLASAEDHPLIKPRSRSTKRQRLVANSRAIDRGAVGWSIDGRSREGRFLSAYQANLALHVGGSPSRVQWELIRRAARLALHLELQDEKLLATEEPLTDHAARQYLAWNNSLVRTLREIGLKGVTPDRSPSLAEIIAGAAGTQPDRVPQRAPPRQFTLADADAPSGALPGESGEAEH